MVDITLDVLIPSWNRIVLTTIAVLIYFNTYKKLGTGVIGPALFPTFYIAYMVYFYPENLNWRDPSKHTIPGEGNIIDEANTLISNKYASIFIFIPLYLGGTYLLYKKKIDRIIRSLFEKKK